jgi:hypothetical protein
MAVRCGTSGATCNRRSLFAPWRSVLRGRWRACSLRERSRWALRRATSCAWCGFRAVGGAGYFFLCFFAACRVIVAVAVFDAAPAV